MRRAARLLAPLLLTLGMAVAPVRADAPAASEATRFYPADADGAGVLDAALAEAAAQGRVAVIVFGADWCHDSRALARTLTSEAFSAEFGGRYGVTFIDVGKPQTGNGRNLDLVARFGIRKLKSTPAMFLISPRGKRINTRKDAIGWRNADSRGEAAILEWFRVQAA